MWCVKGLRVFRAIFSLELHMINYPPKNLQGKHHYALSDLPHVWKETKRHRRQALVPPLMPQIWGSFFLFVGVYVLKATLVLLHNMALHIWGYKKKDYVKSPMVTTSLFIINQNCLSSDWIIKLRGQKMTSNKKGQGVL